MEEKQNAEKNPDETEKPKRNPFAAAKALYQSIPIGRRIAIGALSIFIALLLFSIFHPNMGERIKFVSENTLNLLILVAIVVQAYIYSKQWKAMQDSLRNP